MLSVLHIFLFFHLMHKDIIFLLLRIKNVDLLFYFSPYLNVSVVIFTFTLIGSRQGNLIIK